MEYKITYKLENSLSKVEQWVERHRYMAYEPFDGLTSAFRPLTFGNLLLDRVLMQLVRQSPVNLRPLMGIRPLPSTKGRGYMTWAYLERFRRTGDDRYKARALEQLDWLDKNKSPRFENHSWANHFDFASRGGRYSKHDSIVVWTSLIGHAYLDAYELFGIDRHRKIIESITRWIMDLPVTKDNAGLCIAYQPNDATLIHNASMLGASFLATAGKMMSNSQALKRARMAMHYSCAKQLSNGAWWYGEEPYNRWIDNFHTGYNLDSLYRYIAATGDDSLWEYLIRGFEFYKSNFFEKNGIPRYYHNRTYPVDSQCAGQALETLTLFSDIEPSSLETARKIAGWWIDNMQARDGHFYFRMYPGGIKAKMPMMHWAQCTLYKGITMLFNKLSEIEKTDNFALTTVGVPAKY
ncbi:MAG: hypothetical protein GF401_00185 [Chitinivibrionales bacterium]|nr:hypothetical protein [Chitinivibrionales bacterium]